MHIGQPKIAALKTERQAFMIQAEQMQNRRVQIVNMNAVFHRIKTEFIGLADDLHQLSLRRRPTTS